MTWLVEQIAPHAGVVGLLIFFGFFIGAAFWAFRPANKVRLERYAQIPLREENDHDSR